MTNTTMDAKDTKTVFKSSLVRDIHGVTGQLCPGDQVTHCGDSPSVSLKIYTKLVWCSILLIQGTRSTGINTITVNNMHSSLQKVLQ